MRVSNDRFVSVIFLKDGIRATLTGSPGETTELTALAPLVPIAPLGDGLRDAVPLEEAEWLVQTKHVLFSANGVAVVEFSAAVGPFK